MMSKKEKSHRLEGRGARREQEAQRRSWAEDESHLKGATLLSSKI